jgi:hypothetical protein
LHTNAGRLWLGDSRVILCGPHGLALRDLPACVVLVTAPLLLAHAELLLLVYFLRLLLLIESRMESRLLYGRDGGAIRSMIILSYSDATAPSHHDAIRTVIDIVYVDTWTGALRAEWATLPHDVDGLCRELWGDSRLGHLFIARDLEHFLDDEVLLFSIIIIRRASKSGTSGAPREALGPSAL